MTFSTESASDPGTVYYYRNVLNMRNVKGKVKNSYRPHKMLYCFGWYNHGTFL